MARLVRGVRATPGGDRVAVVFVSDHGEQIRERGAVGHTWGVYDEEVRVPFWIDVPAGALAPEPAARLRALREHARHRARRAPDAARPHGHLGRAGDRDARGARCPARACSGRTRRAGPVVLTNCSSIFACAFKNWGAMSLDEEARRDRERHATGGASTSRSDPLEQPRPRRRGVRRSAGPRRRRRARHPVLRSEHGEIAGSQRGGHRTETRDARGSPMTSTTPQGCGR